MNINLSYVEVNSERLEPKLRSQKIRSTFYTNETNEALCINYFVNQKIE